MHCGLFASIFGGFIDIGYGKIKAFSVCRGGYGITRFSAYDSYELIDAPTFCMQGSFAHAFLKTIKALHKGMILRDGNNGLIVIVDSKYDVHTPSHTLRGLN